MSKVKHIVLLKFQTGITEQQIEQHFSDFLDLTESLPGIEDYVSGANNSSLGKNDGFTHGLAMTFSDAAARDAYSTNASYLKFRETADAMLEKFLILDFEV